MLSNLLNLAQACAEAEKHYYATAAAIWSMPHQNARLASYASGMEQFHHILRWGMSEENIVYRAGVLLKMRELAAQEEDGEVDWPLHAPWEELLKYELLRVDEAATLAPPPSK